ncbi:solute carrier family 22 member 14 [Equus quagga]|uniref:solute carrier family 22 member 14 n=1 Tax=Equus quagga TaxID=89248 RepID=UPI001EE25CC3|nr:solute carrier family 22 member 14 [Equus quagga]XP_046536415.1 solute carrier family 22 member 14 [Equus quagga]
MARENNFKVELQTQPSSKILNQHETAPRHNSWSLNMLLRRLRATEGKKDDKFSNILDAVGEFGTFQRRLVALTFIPNVLSAVFMFADLFMFTAQKPYCNASWILAVGPNLSEAEQLNLTLPRAPNGSFLTCLMYLPVAWDLASIIQYGLNHTESCHDGWIYPETKQRSLINEFDLVCGKETSTETVQTMFMAGLLIGSLIFGFISDRLGRYPTILLSLLGLIVFGFGTAFVNSFHQYLFFRFAVSQALVGYSISSTSLATEWLVGDHRAHAIILEHCFFAVGVMFLTGLAYSLPHWRMLFLLGGAPVFSFIFYIWILPESPRWLMMKGKVEEAKQVLCYAAGVNKKTIPLSLLDKLQLPGKKMDKASVLDFYNNRHLRKVTLVMGCVWFTVGYSYFTLSFKLKDFGVNIYFRQVIPSIMEVPARLCCIFLLEQMGRKWSLIATLFQGTMMCLLILIIPSELKSALVLMVVFGEFSMAASVTVFFIYTAELLPTVLRATGLGLVSLAWAAGAISSLVLISQNLTLLPVFLCLTSAILALSLCSLLPETQDQPLSDSLESYPLQFRNTGEDTMSDDTLYDDAAEEVVKNTILNASVMKLDTDILPSSSQPTEADRKDD